jgi:predicted kinase
MLASVPTVHVLSGLIGSGKSTLARRLERELPAVRISLDEWIVGLFGPEMPEPLTGEFWFDRAERSLAFALPLARQALSAGVDVVLDCGFLTRRERDRARAFAAAAGAAIKLYWVRAATEERRRRIRARNSERGDTFAVFVRDDMFDSLPFEPPSADELEGATVIDT